jgi:OmcA/MtrC family decaheme c-type cytochrome
MKISLARLALIAFVVSILAGCGGGGGDGAAPAPTSAVSVALAPAPVPPGNAPINVANLTPEQFAALQPQVVFGGAVVNSPPQVSFAIQDPKGNPIIGFGGKSTSATSATGSVYNNLVFAIAKLVPGTAVPGGGTTPSRWVSYMVVSTSKNATTGALTHSAGRPGTENVGTLVDNGNGTYTYTFYRDIKEVQNQLKAISSLTDTDKAALGGDTAMTDLTFDASAVHRLTIQVSGNAPGTSTNTPDGSNSGKTAVLMTNPTDAILDFIPATGKPVTASDPSRVIVATEKCEECHRKLGGIPGDSSAASPALFHNGARNEVKYCVVCHTEQRKYGRTESALDANNAFIKPATGCNASTDNPNPYCTYLVDGRAIGNLPNYIHKTHLGPILAKKNYDFGGVKFNEVHFPQDIRNCTKCHDGSSTSTAKTAQGDNWKNVPSRLACGACHDGINFATGKGVTLADANANPPLTTTTIYPGGSAHGGGAQPDDTLCALCHSPAKIDTYHLPVTPANEGSFLHVANGSGNTNTNSAWIASNTSRLPAGAIKVSYEIKSVSVATVSGKKRPQMVFRLLQNGARKDLNVHDSTNPSPVTGKREIWDNFMGAPSLQFVWAVTQDGITPADFNASASAYLRCLWNGTAQVPDPNECTSGGTLTGPDSNGFYTATLTNAVVADDAVMVTGGIGFSYNVRSTLPLTQTNVEGYPTGASPVAVGATDATATSTQLLPSMPNRTGGLIVIAPNVTMVATGYTGRRPIVEDARCNKCHQELGTFTEDAFHAGQRNDGTTCSWCHTPNRASSGWSADSVYFVHAIHAASKRKEKFNWHAASATDGFFNIHYPGILNQCETCHLPNTYDFSATASASALPNRLYRLTANGTINASVSSAPDSYVPKGVNYGSNFSFNASTGLATQAAGTTLVNSPIAAACSACHDSDLALNHMKSNGGSFYKDRTTALATTEQCTLCHLAGKVADIKVMHAK